MEEVIFNYEQQMIKSGAVTPGLRASEPASLNTSFSRINGGMLNGDALMG